MIKQLFAMNKGERIGAIILLSLITIAIGVNIYINKIAVETVDSKCISTTKKIEAFKKDIILEQSPEEYWGEKETQKKKVTQKHQDKERDISNEAVPMITEN